MSVKIRLPYFKKRCISIKKVLKSLACSDQFQNFFNSIHTLIFCIIYLHVIVRLILIIGIRMSPVLFKQVEAKFRSRSPMVGDLKIIIEKENDWNGSAFPVCQIIIYKRRFLVAVGDSHFILFKVQKNDFSSLSDL